MDEFYLKILAENYENFKSELCSLGMKEEEIAEAIKRKFSDEEIRLIEEFKERQAIKHLEIEGLLNILGTTIKHDNTNKLITFLCMLSAYTENSQFNVSFRAPSSTGKSYIPIELAQYFPQEDVILIAYSSPTAFYHDAGTWNEKKASDSDKLGEKDFDFLGSAS
ncbi:MAG: hypothetical protein ACUVTD_08395 [Nitrososphaerales archaeon]